MDNEKFVEYVYSFLRDEEFDVDRSETEDILEEIRSNNYDDYKDLESSVEEDDEDAVFDILMKYM